MIDAMRFISYYKQYRASCEAFRKCSYGDRNRRNKFRVICNKNRYAHKQGLLSTVFGLLPHMIVAREYGYIPMVDLCRNSRPQILLQELELAKKENAWEYYFTQPNRTISLDEVRQSRYVEEQVKDFNYNPYYYLGDRVPNDIAQIQFLRKALCQNIHLQMDIKRRVISEKQRLFSKSDKILGIGIRAGYRAGIMNNMSIFNKHPIVGSCTDYIKDIEKKLKEWNYDSFFLTIDDRSYLEEIKKYFGQNCIYMERPRIHYFQDALKDIPGSFDGSGMIEFDGLTARKRNEDYLVELYLLAQCDSLCASRGTGHNFAYLLNNGKYYRVNFWDLGEFQYGK